MNWAIRLSIVILGATIAFQGFTISAQQDAIDAMGDQAKLAMTYEANTSAYVVTLHRLLEKHIEDGCSTISGEPVMLAVSNQE